MNGKKRLIVILSLVATIVASLCFVACKGNGNDNKKETLVINNKTELTAEWVEGGDARTLDVTHRLNGVIQKNVTYTVSSSDSDVIEVGDDNVTLNAVGGGTATITVKTQKASDSVEITVTPSLKGVSISNKNDLKKAWVAGEAARSLTVKFNPDYYDTNKPEYTVVSSAPGVIEVGSDKTTLTAKAVGTATITVTAGSYSDSVELTVRPVMTSLTVENKEVLGEEWTDWTKTRVMEITMQPAEYYNAENTPVTVTCEPAGVIEAKGTVLTAKAVGIATVTVAAGNVKDTFTVNVLRGVPVLAIADVPGFEATEEGGVINAVEGETPAFPMITAKSCDGTSLTVETEIPQEVTYTESTRSLSALKGSYTITVSATDNVDSESRTEKTITLNIYRKVLGWTDGTWETTEPYKQDAEQKVTNTTGGYQVANFNMAASEYYYAEAEFNLTAGCVVGLSHMKDGEHGRWFGITVNNWGEFDFKATDFDTSKFSGSWDLDEWNKYGLMIAWAYQLRDHRGLAANENTGIHKIATARVGKVIYAFWNDQYVGAYNLDWYSADPTIPGFFTLNFSSGSGYAKGINYFAGKEEVEAKVNSLTENGKTVISQYVPFGGENGWANDSKNIDNRNFTRGETTSEKGVNFDFTNARTHWNGGMVSPYIYTDGDFTFEFDYKKTSGNGTMWLEMRNYRYDGEKFYLGANYEDSSNVRLLGGTDNTAYAYDGFDASEGIHFVVRAKKYDTYREFFLIAQSKANPKQMREVTLKYGATADEANGILQYADWDKPNNILWHNVNIAGEYSNIVYTPEAKDLPLAGVSITNKTALTSTPWVLGEGPKTLELNFFPSIYNTNHPDFTVESSSANVEVGEDKLTLTAKSAGMATITVTCGDFTDTITLTVRPVMTSLTVDNKEDLAASWLKWDAAKTINVTFAPAEFWKQNNTDVTVTCSDPEAITANGYAITAKKLGTFTVTVSAYGCEDTFTINVEKRDNPDIDFAETANFVKEETGGTMNGYALAALTLPAATATSTVGEDITANMTVGLKETYEGVTLEDGVITGPKGTYDVVYTIAEGEKSVTKTITVNLYRDLLGWNDGAFSMETAFVADAEQKVNVSKNGFQLAQFKGGYSEYYYAEVTYYATAGNLGIANFTEDNHTRMLVNAIQTNGDHNYKLSDFDTSKGWTLQEYNDSGVWVAYSYKLDAVRGLTANADAGINKVAFLRLGDYFYTFWNDQYVDSVTNRYYAGKATVPGLFTSGISERGYASGIEYFTGKEATEAKFNALTHNGADLIVSYAPDTWASNSVSADGSLFTRGETSEEKGINYTYVDGTRKSGNDTMVGTYMYFDGDFSFSWTYKNNSTLNNNGCESRMWLELRNYMYNETNFVFGAEYSANTRMFANTPRFEEGSKWFEKGFDKTHTLKFTLTRILKESAEELTMTIVDLDDTSVTLTRTITIDSTYDSRWDQPVILHWKNVGVSGEYSNVMWKNFNGNGNWVEAGA